MAEKTTKSSARKPAGATKPKRAPAKPRREPPTASAAPRRPAADGPAAVSPVRAFIQTVGRRKSAVARLRFSPRGKGAITVNGKMHTAYFPYPRWQEIVVEPLPLVGLAGVPDISVKVSGGGLPAQAVAIRLALARALILHNPDWRPTLRKMGWLTRDPREKERKKPGLKRARRAPQWQKR